MNEQNFEPFEPRSPMMYPCIKELHKMLMDVGVVHTFRPIIDGYQIVFTDRNGNVIADVIEHKFSYGANIDTVEVMGLDVCDGDVIGYLSAEECFKKIMAECKRWDIWWSLAI